ncbi:hypothetical protein KYB31_05610 [Clostridium felsineum]|uniref:hypothetical protein n=1 Tax=Clostridium felsineum TaxID=36839 RepID=UPI00214D1426|nr:hypothetical protein [Clostridium felsineum]MCR3758472.1 hypothetical protein [Clostridium felsineum]
MEDLFCYKRISDSGRVIIIKKDYEDRSGNIRTISEQRGIPSGNIRKVISSLGYKRGLKPELEKLLVYDEDYRYLSKFSDEKFY